MQTDGTTLEPRQGWAMTEQVMTILRAFSKLDWAAPTEPDYAELWSLLRTTAIHMDELHEVVDAQVQYYQDETATTRLRAFYSDVVAQIRKCRKP